MGGEDRKKEYVCQRCGKDLMPAVRMLGMENVREIHDPICMHTELTLKVCGMVAEGLSGKADLGWVLQEILKLIFGWSEEKLRDWLEENDLERKERAG